MRHNRYKTLIKKNANRKQSDGDINSDNEIPFGFTYAEAVRTSINKLNHAHRLPDVHNSKTNPRECVPRHGIQAMLELRYK